MPVLICWQEYTVPCCLPYRHAYCQATGSRLRCGSGTITCQMRSMFMTTDRWNCSFGLHCLASHTGRLSIIISMLIAFITTLLIILKLPLGQPRRCESMSCCSGGTGTIPWLTFYIKCWHYSRKVFGRQRKIPHAPERVAASSVACLAAQCAVAEAPQTTSLPAGSQTATQPSASAIEQPVVEASQQCSQQ